MRAELKTTIDVERFAVFAEMAWLQRRPELGHLCRAARGDGERIAPATVQAALPGLSDAAAANTMRWCEMLGLCDEHGALTELGKDVADTSEAPVPEQGVYGLWVVTHPLLGRRVLNVERLAPTLDAPLKLVQDLPVVPDFDKVFQSVVTVHERFIVRDIPTKHGSPGALRHDKQPSCDVAWTIDFDAEENHWQLSGLIAAGDEEGDTVRMQHNAEHAELDYEPLLRDWGLRSLGKLGRWSPEERRLALAFAQVPPQSRETFAISVEMEDLEALRHGRFDTAELHNIPIGPESDEDGQRWAMARLERKLKREPAFQSRAALRSLFVGLVEDTPLEPCAPRLPSHDELLADGLAQEDPSVYWGLAAPVDLAPAPLDDSDLAELRIGGPAPVAEPTRMVGKVVVPYRGGWTMRQFVQRTLLDGPPTRALLCDRYVRGPDNLATLELFMAALREVAPELKLDVWTEGKEDNFRQIQQLTGKPVTPYRTAFGRGWPHDRYLLLVGPRGKVVAWQLSNSPLHARGDAGEASPTTPLRWKDLVATRLETEELMRPLQRWIQGGGQ